MGVVQTTKEIIRASMSKLGLYDTVRKARGKSLVHLQPATLQDRFKTIYETRHWTLGDAEIPGSGFGSSLVSTENLRRELPGLLRDIGVETLLDLGCGDFTWMKEIDIGDVRYIGADIVPSLIEENTAKFGKENISFIHADGVTDELPDADAVMIREVLFHLSFEDIRAVLLNVLGKTRRHLLMTSDSLSAFNADIRSGDWRLLNLRGAPFRFPEPILRIDESRIRPGRFLGVWKAEDIPRI